MIHQRSIAYRLLSGFMAVWMLVVSLGATVDMHFCRGHLVDYKIWGKARSCGMKEEVAACTHATHGISRPKCCDQKTHQLYFDQTNAGAQQTSVVALTQSSPVALLPAWDKNWVHLEITRLQPNIPVHGPPWQVRDRTILFASILC